jgi:hypothetical protein
MSFSAASYRKLAENCLDMASRAAPKDKDALLKMAEICFEIAAEQSRRDGIDRDDAGTVAVPSGND